MRWRSLLLTVTIGGFLLTGCGDDAETGNPVLENSVVWTLDGEATEMHEFLGRPLVVNFFAETCPPCIREMPAFDTVFGEVADEVDFLGVSEDATAEAGQRIVETTEIGYAVVWDADGSALMTLQAMGLPTTAFVDGSGEVLELHTGEMSADELRERLAVHFGI